MRFLVDEALSPRLALLLAEAGHEAIHAREVGLLGRTDADVLAEAAASRRVVVSVDTDFGELLAVGAEPAASVVLIRRAPHLPPEQAALVLAALAEAEEDLLAGAVVVVTPTRVRVRRFPLRPLD